MAGICRFVINLIPLVIGEFLACLHMPYGDNPNNGAELCRLAMGITRMIAIACRVGTVRKNRAHIMHGTALAVRSMYCTNYAAPPPLRKGRSGVSHTERSSVVYKGTALRLSHSGQLGA